LFNNGSGVFTGLTNYAIGTGPRSVAAADFDSDGDIDLAFTPSGAGINNVGIMMNTGLGTFTPVVNYAVGANPSFVVAGALDANNSVDLAVGYLGGTSISTVMNSGTGTFGGAANYTVGTTPQGVALGDVNGDGFLDLVTANSGTNNASVLLNNGAGIMGTLQNYAVGVNPRMPVLGDVDSDGDLDIAIVNQTPNNVSVLLNTTLMNVQNNVAPFGMPYPPTTPAFNSMNAALATNIVIPFSDNLNAGTVIAANFRVQGLMTGARLPAGTTFTAAGMTATVNPGTDFLAGERVFVSVNNAQSLGGINTRPFVMSFRTASGNMTGAFHPTTAVANTSPKRIVYARFNADAFMDMAVAGTGGIELFTGSASGVFTSAGMIAGSGGIPFFGLAVADMNNDNSPDIIGGYDNNTRTVRVFTNNGLGIFTPLAPLAGIGVAANNINDMAVADFDADGNMDVAVVCGGGVANGNYAVLRNTGGGTLAVQQTANSPNIYGVDTGDLDGDGDMDIAYTRFNAGEIFTLINNGAGTFVAGQTLVFGAEARNVKIADVNNDQRMDLVVVRGGVPSDMRIFVNNGMFATPFPGTASQTLTLGAWAVDVALFDVDGDTYLDAVMTEDIGGRVVFSKNNAGTFAAPTVLTTIANSLFLAAADIDNDNDLDIAFGVAGNAVHVMKYGTQPLITTVAPPRNGNGLVNPNIAAANAPVTVNFLAPQTITTNSYSVLLAQQLFQVHGGQTGSRTRASGFAPFGAYSGGAATMTFTPSANFRPGELVSVSVTNASSSVSAPNNSVGIRTRPYVLDYRVAVPSGFGTFVPQTPVAVTGANPVAAATGDMDGDGDVDMVVPASGSNNVNVFINNGSGGYSAHSSSPFAVG
jgi:hypothetical protein